MHYNIIVESEALEDLQNIYSYITEQDSRSKARKFIFELQKKIGSLSQMPHRFYLRFGNLDQVDVRKQLEGLTA